MDVWVWPVRPAALNAFGAEELLWKPLLLCLSSNPSSCFSIPPRLPPLLTHPSLVSPQKPSGRGELLLSLCYQSTTNTLTVVVLKARSLLKTENGGPTGMFMKNIFNAIRPHASAPSIWFGIICRFATSAALDFHHVFPCSHSVLLLSSLCTPRSVRQGEHVPWQEARVQEEDPREEVLPQPGLQWALRVWPARWQWSEGHQRGAVADGLRHWKISQLQCRHWAPAAWHVGNGLPRRALEGDLRPPTSPDCQVARPVRRLGCPVFGGFCGLDRIWREMQWRWKGFNILILDFSVRVGGTQKGRGLWLCEEGHLKWCHLSINHNFETIGVQQGKAGHDRGNLVALIAPKNCHRNSSSAMQHHLHGNSQLPLYQCAAQNVLCVAIALIFLCSFCSSSSCKWPRLRLKIE